MVALFPFCFGVSSVKLNIRKKGTLIIKGLVGNLVICKVVGTYGFPVYLFILGPGHLPYSYLDPLCTSLVYYHRVGSLWAAPRH